MVPKVLNTQHLQAQNIQNIILATENIKWTKLVRICTDHRSL